MNNEVLFIQVGNRFFAASQIAYIYYNASPQVVDPYVNVALTGSSEPVTLHGQEAKAVIAWAALNSVNLLKPNETK